MRQHHVLDVGDAELVVRVALGEVGEDAHLLRGDVARRPPIGFTETVTAV
jgi:hypothetical protein